MYNLRAFHPSRFVDLQENTVRWLCLLYSEDSCDTYCLKIRAPLPPFIGKLILCKYQKDSGNISHFYFKKLLDIFTIQQHNFLLI